MERANDRAGDTDQSGLAPMTSTAALEARRSEEMING
jgi:hypothetical protein